MMCSFCKQVTEHNEPCQEHQRNAEHSNWKQVVNFTLITVVVIIVPRIGVHCKVMFEVCACLVFLKHTNCLTLSAGTWLPTATVVLQMLSFSGGLSFGLKILKVLLRM